MWIDFSTYPMFWICCPIILLCLLGFCRKESLWTILLIPFCLFFATFFAVGYYQPLANLFDRFLPKYAFYNDLLAFTIIYAAVFAVNVFVTHFLSRINVFFPDKVNLIGNITLLSVIFVVFYFCVAPMFFYLIPEAPPRTNWNALEPMPQFSLYEQISKGSLSPIGGDPKTDQFKFTDFYKAEVGKNAIVYSQVLQVSGSEKARGDEWQQKDKVSPNVSVKKEKKKD
ncbi:MAG: hypothetical protein K6E55_02590 [Thermoguttaceae bacterium]|nr:hypothetical protein [Thermoguttaceae bacterium]